jgi:hypothetical protein
MSNRSDMKDVKEIQGIEVTESIKYLGTYLFCDRKKTIASIKTQMQKFMSYLRGKIRTEQLTTAAIIFGAYYRSLMIYFLTPLFAAGAITGKEIDNIEANFKRSQYGLKGDIKSQSI